ncbi:MAG TPA: glycosyltransferase [Thermoflexia bacterium]|nr:glycosyltransferase [Thermoflexia bacterium]
MRVLYVTPYVPSPIRTRPYNLIRALIRLGHQVTLLTAASTAPEDRRQADELRDWGVQVEAFPVPAPRSLLNCLLALPSREPLQAVYAYHPQMKHRLETLLQTVDFDVVHIEHLRAARLVRAVRDRPVVYDAVDCIAFLFEQTVQNSPQPRARWMARLDLARTRWYEAHLLTQFDRVVITSRRDKEALEALARRYLPPREGLPPITVVTNGVDLEYFRPGEEDGRDYRTVVFTGKMSYHANVASVLYFAAEVLPRIWARDPAVRFQIVGKDPPEAVRRLAADERIEVTGYVEDLRPYLARAGVVVCPARYAVGIQNKVLEAMAMARPVVCTDAAFAGLQAEAGRDALVADDPETFAAHVLRLCTAPDLARRLGWAGRRYVETHHNWEDSARRLVAVYEAAQAGVKEVV